MRILNNYITYIISNRLNFDFLTIGKVYMYIMCKFGKRSNYARVLCNVCHCDPKCQIVWFISILVYYAIGNNY